MSDEDRVIQKLKGTVSIPMTQATFEALFDIAYMRCPGIEEAKDIKGNYVVKGESFLILTAIYLSSMFFNL